MPCEMKLVINLILEMMVWFGKWVRSIEDITTERMMDAIRIFTLNGIETSGE